jgi:predicted nucleotidyltransferase
MQNPRTNFTNDELQRMQAETGVDVYALLDLLERTPAERLRIAMANAQNLVRLRGHAPDAPNEMTTPGALNALAILGALHKREVRFVVIGGVAGYLLGANLPSANLDLCFASDSVNERQLVTALNDMHAQMRGSSDDQIDEQTLRRVEMLSFKTDHGALHCLVTPAGTEGHDDLRAHADSMGIDGVATYVASLEDLIRMKEAADRPKDRLALVTLRAVQRLRKKR